MSDAALRWATWEKRPPVRWRWARLRQQVGRAGHAMRGRYRASLRRRRRRYAHAGFAAFTTHVTSSVSIKRAIAEAERWMGTAPPAPVRRRRKSRAFRGGGALLEAGWARLPGKAPMMAARLFRWHYCRLATPIARADRCTMRAAGMDDMSADACLRDMQAPMIPDI